jgi:fructose-1,6-bisphosphatase I
MPKGVTVTEHILLQERETPGATGAFSLLLSELIVAAKIVDREVRRVGLIDAFGFTGETNVQGESVMKLDQFANNLIISRMEKCGQLCIMASEEHSEPIEIPNKYIRGNYVLCFDPLDGSSNIDANVSIGTIFSIHRRISPGDAGTLDDLLRGGREQVAAGYFLYSSATMMIYTTGKGVYGFTLDPSVGEFLLSHENIRIPVKGKIYSVNEGNYNYWGDGVRNYLNYLKETDKSTKRPYSTRYIGSLVADFHRTLLYGGIFMYPADNKDPHKPYGKLRLLYECAPLSFIVEEAGGYASTGEMPVLDVIPKEIHQRVPLYIGSKEDVLMAEQFVREKERA